MCLILVAAKNVERRDQRDAVLEIIGPSCLQYDSVEVIFNGCKAITITPRGCDPSRDLLVFTVFPNDWQRSVSRWKMMYALQVQYHYVSDTLIIISQFRLEQNLVMNYP